MKRTWRELEREGVRRCCVMFSGGKRCRRRASEAFGLSWCDKHGPEMQAHIAWANKIIRDESTRSAHEDESDE